ncbi:MAG TPA: hypothetical protein VFW65_09905 [Pseudonocardiaceae bacterium]|nr:hypothetical protein [Pseudonocardiaceae bacterium]
MSVSGVIIPLSSLDDADHVRGLAATPGTGDLCPVCRNPLGAPAQRESGKLLAELDGKLTRADVEFVRVLLRELVASRDPEVTRHKIESDTGPVGRLATFLPRGYADTVAVLALVVALATLAEQTVADFHSAPPPPADHGLQPLLFGKKGSTLALDSPRPGRIQLDQPWTFSGTFQPAPRAFCWFHRPTYRRGLLLDSDLAMRKLSDNVKNRRAVSASALPGHFSFRAHVLRRGPHQGYHTKGYSSTNLLCWFALSPTADQDSGDTLCVVEVHMLDKRLRLIIGDRRSD